MKKSKSERKDEHALFGQGRGCYAEKLTVICIQYFKPIFTKAPFGEFDWKNGKFLVGKIWQICFRKSTQVTGTRGFSHVFSLLT